MKLVLTAIDKYFDEKDELILLGKWCLSSQNKNYLNKYKIIDYHWEGMDDAYKKSIYAYETYEKFIKILSEYLNNIHKKKYTSRYWEILVGPWLWMFICIFYDRYLAIKSATNKFNNLESYISFNSYTPDRYIDFDTIVSTDEYNFFLFSQIINNCNLNINKTYISKEETKKLSNSLDEFLNPNKINNIKNINLKLDLNPRKILIKIRLFLLKLINTKQFIGERNNDFLNLNMPLGGNDIKDLYKSLNNNKLRYNLRTKAITIRNLEIKLSNIALLSPVDKCINDISKHFKYTIIRGNKYWYNYGGNFYDYYGVGLQEVNAAWKTILQVIYGFRKVLWK